MTQDPKKDAMNFLIRLMDTRQKILFACKEEDENELKYNPSVVQGLLRDAIETGLISDNICTCLYPYVQDPATTDEDFIQQMQHAVSAETERKKKLGLITTQKKVNEMSAKDEKFEKSKTDPLIAAIDALKTEVGTLKSEVRKLKASKQAGKMHSGNLNRKRATGKSHPAAWQACKNKGNAINCSHCFLCGGSNHYAHKCRAKEGDKLGNPQRLVLRDKH